MKQDRETNVMKNIASQLEEHFIDYVVIGRIKDGLVWRYSDRTFAMGSTTRLQDRLATDDRLIVEEILDNDND